MTAHDLVERAVARRPTAPSSETVPGLPPDALVAALLASADALGLPVAVKEIASGRYLHMNARMAACLAGPGAAAAELLGRTDGELLGPACAALQAAEQSASAASGPQVSEHRLERNDDKRQFTVVRQALAAAEGEAPRWLLGVWIETTRERRVDAQLRQALAQIEAQQQADSSAVRQEASPRAGLRDAVTGLYEGAHFDDQLRREVDLSSREHREFALVVIELDPPAGDALALGPVARTRVLEALGRLLTSNTRPMDSACRVADDRFAILLSGVGLATAHSRMEGLRRQCATQIVVHEGRSLGFTVSMGVASFPHTAHTQDGLLEAADSALRAAQRRGGNHVTLASIRFEAE